MRQDPSAINHVLRSRGFASLGQAGALIPQLALFVRDDYHFRALLVACEPEDRRDMYEALKPNLRFKVRSLDEYLIEAAQDAERRQLPTIGTDGQFKPYTPPEAQSVEETITRIARETVAKFQLHVVCKKCTREQVFYGLTKQDAVDALRAAGWCDQYNGDATKLTEVCPTCAPAPRE